MPDTPVPYEPPAAKGEPTIWGISYSPPSAAKFCLNFIGRNWFGSRLKGAEAMTFAEMLITLYAVQKNGLLMSKMDVMRTIGAKHVSTAKRYTDLAIKMGFIKTGKSTIVDGRIELLFLTDAGVRAVERELETITSTARWLVADLSDSPDDRIRGYDMVLQETTGLTVEPPKLEELALVNDALVAMPPGLSRRDASGRSSQPTFRPLTVPRWIAAYSETLRFDANNREALERRARNNADMLGDYESALKDFDKLVELDSDGYLVHRAEVHLRNKNYDQAIADIDRLAALRGGENFGQATRAFAYAGKNDWARAFEDIDAVLADPLFKDSVGPEEWLLLRARALIHLQRYEEALPDLKKALPRYEETAAMYRTEQEGPERILSLSEAEFQEAIDFADQMAAYIRAAIKEIKRAGREARREVRKSRKRK